MMSLITFFRQKYKRWRTQRFRATLGNVHPTADVTYDALVIGGQNLEMKEHALFQPGCKLILTGGRLTIGRWTSLAYNVTVITGNHTPTVGYPHHLASRMHLNDKERDIVIGDDCWVAANVTLLSGAKLGRGAVAGANALVNRPVPPYAVVAGIPAKIVAVKFTKEQIKEHERQIYTPEERMTDEELDQLFATYYEGKKAIGTSQLSDEQRQRYKEYYHL